MGALSLWAPLIWVPAVMRYSNVLRDSLFTNSDYFVHFSVYPMLACWISVFPLSLATILLFNLIGKHSLWSALPVTVGTCVLIFVMGFLSTWGDHQLRGFLMWVLAGMLYLSIPSVIVWIHYFLVQLDRGPRQYDL